MGQNTSPSSPTGPPAQPVHVESQLVSQVPAEMLRAGVILNRTVWPSKQSIEERIAQVECAGQQDCAVMSRSMWHYIREGDDIVAMAISFRRTVECDGRRFPVLALAGVCTHPDHRGKGLGRAVVRSAWARLSAAGSDLDLAVCLFQTGVPTFYEELGARLVANRFYTADPEMRPFWDKYVMIYPANGPWPTEAVDLLGNGW